MERSCRHCRRQISIAPAIYYVNQQRAFSYDFNPGLESHARGYGLIYTYSIRRSTFLQFCRAFNVLGSSNLKTALVLITSFAVCVLWKNRVYGLSVGDADEPPAILGGNMTAILPPALGRPAPSQHMVTFKKYEKVIEEILLYTRPSQVASYNCMD